MFFTLALGAVAVTSAAALQKIDADMKRAQTARDQSLNQLSSAIQQLPASLPPVALSPVTINNSTVGNPATVWPNMNRALLSKQPLPRLDAAVSASQDSQRRREAVRQAEMQRDRINEKERRIEQLQKSIESTEEYIRRIRGYGGDERIFVQQRDELVKQKWELQR